MSEIELPEYHEESMGCGLEDQWITDRYEACRYGYEQALEYVNTDVIEPLERQLVEARFAVKTLIELNEIAYNEGYNDRQKHNKKDYEKTKSSLKVKQLKEEKND